MTTLYHVTPTQNVFPIGVHGILQSEAATKSGCMYLVTKSKIAWAINHTKKRHNVDDVAVITVEIPRRWAISGKIKRYRFRGVWKCVVDILPCHIQDTAYDPIETDDESGQDDYYLRCSECLQRAVAPFDEVQIGFCQNCHSRLVYCWCCNGTGLENPDERPEYWVECECCQGTGLEKKYDRRQSNE